MNIFEINWDTYDGGVNCILAHPSKGEDQFHEDVKNAAREVAKGWNDGYFGGAYELFKQTINRLVEYYGYDRARKFVPLHSFPSHGSLFTKKYMCDGEDRDDYKEWADYLGKDLLDSLIEKNDEDDE